MDYERTVFLEASPDAVFDHTASLAGFRQLFPFPLDWRDGPTGRWSEGDVLDFRFRVGPLRIRHTARIVAFEPGHRFVDEMTRGVFCRFRHEHQYRTYRDGTRMTDRVVLTLGCGNLVDRWLVRPVLDRVFRKRHDALRAHFLEAQR